MAIINNNVQNVKFLRNGTIFRPEDDLSARETARLAMNKQLPDLADGTAILGRYLEDNGVVETLVGFAYVSGETRTLTIIDVAGGDADVERLRDEINAKLGTDFIASGNTVEANLTALSGNSQSTSAETSVEGAKRYAEDLISGLDYADSAATGEYVSQVSQADGVIAVTRVALPSSADTAEAKKVVIAVAEDKGQIEVSRGSITSSGKTIVLTDTEDGGVNFEANVDGTTIIINEETGTMSVASSALVQYEGDDDTIQISAVSEGVRTVSSPLTIQKVTTGLSEIVKEEYHLIGASGNTIGAPVQIYKDSHIVSITYITDTGDTHYQNLEYVYIDASGNTQTTYVDMSELVIEAEFASGVTVTDGVAHGVVDPTSESFLTVGADGFKLAGVQGAIDAAVEDLDANESGSTEHITVKVVETDGVITTVTVEEDNIANADDLAELSAKTITNIKSTNSSINISTANTDDDTVEVDVITDADKILMSGFSATTASSLSGIAESDSIATAFEKTNAVITENERVTAEALTDLDDRLDIVEDTYISGVSVNGSALTVANHVASISISGATSSVTATSTEAIVVDTDANGNITLGISTVDCGYYN